MGTISTGTTPSTALEVVRGQIAPIKAELEQMRLHLGVDVLVFYLACDPFMPNFLRALAVSNADYPEACSHFRLRPLEPLP